MSLQGVEELFQLSKGFKQILTNKESSGSLHHFKVKARRFIMSKKHKSTEKPCLTSLRRNTGTQSVTTKLERLV